MLRELQNPQKTGPEGTPSGGLGDLLRSLIGGTGSGLSGFGGILGGGAAGGILGGGLGDLLKQFQQNGFGEKASSWVQSGANADMKDHELQEALYVKSYIQTLSGGARGCPADCISCSVTRGLA
jgi:uncharacterized protein YidB (DUF937 family)